jgi:hypothetical protein
VLKKMPKRFLYTLAALLAITCLSWGQAETGQIAGTVEDPSGSPIANATVKVISNSTNAERVTNSSSSGDFSVSNLPPGEYTISVESSGFSTFREKALVTVGAKVGVDVKLQVGEATTVVEVNETVGQINTETQTLATTVSQTELRELPTLTRNPYALVALTGNASDAGVGNRGVGFAINGQRESSTNILLDGAANNNEFGAGIGQQVPLDSVQEFSIITSSFTAEYGRAGGGVVNVATKSGTNSFHGTAYEFNRVSDLSSNSFDNNARGLDKSRFARNQFGYSAGGPVVKNKLFFFSSTEWLRVRSPAHQEAVTVTPQFIAAMAGNSQAFFNSYYKLKSSDQVLQTFSAQNTGASTLCQTNAACNAFVGANPTLPIFQTVAYTSNADAGAGAPQNQYQTVGRVDYNATDKTQIYSRYALQSIGYLAGFASASPFQGYDTAENDFNNNILVSGVHTFSPNLVSQSKAVFNRLNSLQPFGPAGGNVPTLFTGPTGVAQLGGVSILFPGYNPGTPGGSIPFGGPQNFVQLYQDFTWSRGKHSVRFGGNFEYLRDNRTFGAYEDGAYYLATSGTGSTGQTVQRLLSGVAGEFQAAIYPQGKLPGSTVSLPLGSPNFSRSNRYKEGAVYIQDAWKVKPRFTANIGLRWEHFGVQHNKNPLLDSNFYDPASQIDTPLGIRTGQVSLVPNSTQGSAWKPDYHDFAPRLGFAWDVTGDGKTALRGGYGLGYERNFGNVTYNMIQNPPNYETVSITAANFTTAPISISPANFGPFSGTSGTVVLPKASLRNVDYNIKTAFSNFWSMTLEREITKGFKVEADYSGSRGVHLYDISILNRAGYGNAFLGDPCSAAAQNCLNFLNTQYGGINRRGSGGWSNYNGVTFGAKLNEIGRSGLTLSLNYTYSHALDNLSSTFSDANNQSANNGDFNTGYLDPYARMLDKGSADFDARQRVTLGAVWAIPFLTHGSSLASKLLGGWEIAPIFSGHTGAPYSIFDGGNGYTDYPRAAFNGPIPTGTNSNPAVDNSSPNLFDYLNISSKLLNPYSNPLYFWSDLPPFPSGMTGRNTFRAPGFFDFDLGVYKTFQITERVRMQLRGESYNVINHANLYVIGTSADVENTNPDGSATINACKGCAGSTQDRRNMQLALKIIF